MSKIIITETQLEALKGILMEDPLSSSSTGFISLTEKVSPQKVHQAADAAGIEWDDNEEFMDFSEKITGERHIDDMSSEEMNKLIDAIEDDETQTQIVPISFNIDWNDKIGEVNENIMVAMSPDSAGLFSIGNDIEKYSGLSKAAALNYNETPTDAYAYGLVNVMNGGNEIFFWTNGGRLAGAVEKFGWFGGAGELLIHECIHLARSILTKYVLGENWAEKDWPSIGDKPGDIDEEALTTAAGLIRQQVGGVWKEMAQRYITE